MAAIVALLLVTPVAYAGDRAEREAAAQRAYREKLELMRERETDPAKHRHLYGDFEQFIQLKRYGANTNGAAPMRSPPENYERRGVLPPPEYDRPYRGILLEIRGDKEMMARLCPKTWMVPVTLGCAYVHERDCTIVVANDDILEAAGWRFEIVKRHEVDHCGGWPNHHPGARATTLEDWR